MTTIHAQLLGEQVLLNRDELEQLIELARHTEAVDLQLQEDDWTSADVMRLAQHGGAFDFWNDEGEDIYSNEDGEPI